MGEGHPLIQILRRGIGVHHNGLQNKYKMAVEMLFRCGYLRIVIATETLAYGINMPARTVVFAGDSICLNSVQYQQMSGRAGRRGLDVLGHIVMFEVPRYKLHRLIVAPVPRLRGHMPTPAPLLQRLLALWSNVASQRGVTAAIEKRVKAGVIRCLQMPLYFSDKPALAPVFPLQARLGLDLLVRFGLASPDSCRPSGLSSLSDHLHFADPAGFALVALLQVCPPPRPLPPSIPPFLHRSSAHCSAWLNLACLPRPTLVKCLVYWPSACAPRLCSLPSL